MRKVGQNSATSSELLPDLKDLNQLHWNCEGSWLDSHKNWNSLYPVYTYSELDRHKLPSPRDPSKQYTYLIIWSRPRVNSLYCLCLSLHFHFLPLLPSLPSSFQHLLASLAVICNGKYPSGSSSCQVQLQLYFSLHRLQLSSTIFQVQLLDVLEDFPGYNCLLTFFKFNCKCTSGLLRL
jgi:hypothetical protein